MGFLHPFLLWAIPLAAIPIVIHLLNRRRFQRLRWAAMEFLLAAAKRNRKRLRMEHWILLLLRTLVVLLLVFLVSRPQTRSAVIGDVRTHHVICIDDSASMAHRSGAADTFSEALDRAEELVDKLAETRGGDLLTILRGSSPEVPEMVGMRLSQQTKVRARDLLRGLRVSDLKMDVAQTLSAAVERIEAQEGAGRAQIYLVSDGRQRDWIDQEGAARPRIYRRIKQLDPQRQKVQLWAVGSEERDNLAIIDVDLLSRVAVVGVPLDIAIEIKNQGRDTSAPVEMALEIDGRSRVRRLVEALAAGESAVVTMTHTFHDPGHHGLTASLPQDRFRPDDQRSLALEIKPHSRVLLVDGDPGDREDEAETFFLAMALDPGGDATSGIRAEVVPEFALRDAKLDDVDMVWLCNVPAPGPDVVEKLEAFVAGGGGLAIFLGNQVDPGRYNDRLFKGGEGLLPLALTDIEGDSDDPEFLFLVDKTHGAMSVVTEALELMFARLVQVKRHMGVVEDVSGATRVILRAGGNRGAPIMLSHHPQEGGGEVILVTTTADTHWTTWPGTDAFLIVANQTHKTAARRHDMSISNLGPAGRLQFRLDPGRYRPDIVARRFGGEGLEKTFTATAREPSGNDPVDTDLELELDLSMLELEGLGLFELRLSPLGGSVEQRLLARNLPIEEGELHKLTAGEFRRAYPDVEDRISFVEPTSQKSALTLAGQGEVWRLIAMTMLIILLAETLLAWRFRRGSR